MAMQTDISTLENILKHTPFCDSATWENIIYNAAQIKQTPFAYVLQHNSLCPKTLSEACAHHFQLHTHSLEFITNKQLPTHLIPINILKQHFVLPIAKENNTLIVAISNPEDHALENTLHFQTGFKIKIVFARYDLMMRIHNMILSSNCYQHKEAVTTHALTQTILSDATHRGASDIHFEPNQDALRIRFRIDGLLHIIADLPRTHIQPVTSLLKIFSRCDIAVKRSPQDGRFTHRTNLDCIKDCRLSTYPTVHGEKIVVRLLDTNTSIQSLQTLGLTTTQQKTIEIEIKRPQGFILITGPTGSGKSMTLYTLLTYLNEQHRNISTIEDPVEMQIQGINQSQVHDKIHFTFSSALRALLRQDPDIIMIGEIRDLETANMAIRAAQTGHLVLSTLHTNSAAETITRLQHMGVPTFQIASALTLVIAQRLIRKKCPYCRGQQSDCTQCTNGFQGRVGIFELMPIDHSMQSLIVNNATHHQIAQKNQQSGQVNLYQSAKIVVDQNTTSYDEIFRVIHHNDHETHSIH